jgi:hypothetical protein
MPAAGAVQRVVGAAAPRAAARHYCVEALPLQGCFLCLKFQQQICAVVTCLPEGTIIDWSSHPGSADSPADWHSLACLHTGTLLPLTTLARQHTTACNVRLDLCCCQVGCPVFVQAAVECLYLPITHVPARYGFSTLWQRGWVAYPGGCNLSDATHRCACSCGSHIHAGNVRCTTDHHQFAMHHYATLLFASKALAAPAAAHLAGALMLWLLSALAQLCHALVVYHASHYL